MDHRYKEDQSWTNYFSGKVGRVGPDIMGAELNIPDLDVRSRG